MSVFRTLTRASAQAPYLSVALTGLALSLACGGSPHSDNQPPIFSSSAPTTAIEGHTYSYILAVTDANGDAITLSLATKPTGATFDLATKTLSWIPASAQVGVTQAFDALADDGKGGITHQTWTVTPSANQAPAFSSNAPTTAKEGHAYSYALAVTDANGDAIALSLVSMPAGATLDSTTKTISWIPTTAQAGVAQTFEVLADDGKGGSTHQSWMVTPSTNAAPVFTSAPIVTGTTGTIYTYTPVATDADGDTVAYTLITKPTWAGLSGGVITGTPTASGICHFTLRADDGHGKTADQSWTASIVPAGNHAPVITSTPTASATGGGVYSYTLTANDADGDAVTFELITSPAGATLAGNTITWTPAANQERIASSFTVQAKDVWGAASAPQTWSLTPSGSIRGTRAVNYTPVNWSTGKVTLDPAPATTAIIRAMIPTSGGGFTTVNGGYNPADGTYQVVPVPGGSYWLVLNNNTYVWTDKSQVNLNGFASGRRDAKAATTSPTFLSLSLTNMSPWNAGGDYLQLADWNSNAYAMLDQDSTTFGAIHAGDTAITALQDDWAKSYWLPGLIDTTKGDHPLLLHMATQTVGGESYQVAKEVVEPSSLVMADGVPSSVAGTFTALPVSATPLTFNWARSAFAAYQGAVSPVALHNVDYAGLLATPDVATVGVRGISTDVVQHSNINSAPPVDLNFGSVALPALPGHLDLYFTAQMTFSRSYLFPGATLSVYGNGSLVVSSTTLPTASAPARPLVSPVQNPLLNGGSAFGDLSGVGVSPTLNWTAPALGVPSGYTVYIYNLSLNGTKTEKTQVAALITPTTSLTVPTGVMQAGSSYFMVIRAYVAPGWDPTTTPFAAFAGQTVAYADALSGIIQP